jgi:hypothetical protein
VRLFGKGKTAAGNHIPGGQPLGLKTRCATH